MKSKQINKNAVSAGRAVVCLLIAIVLTVWQTAAQSRQTQVPDTVTGVVVDVGGDPLAGVTVIEKGTSNGTSTNLLGEFTLSITSKTSTLVFTFVGMEPVEVAPQGRDHIEVTMEPSSDVLDEVVVVGYAVMRKSDLTGSVASVRADDIQDRMVTSLEDALRGRVAGVSITSIDGQPGETLDIRIRGTGSINASNSPLYVIDGVLMEEADVNPGDVESIEILKDASSTAIYGSRGANGVVMITTKKGQKGRPRVNLAFSAGHQTPVRLIDMMNNWQYKEHRMHVARTINPATQPANTVGYYDSDGNIWYVPTNKSFSDWREAKTDPDAVNTDWQRAMLRSTWTYDVRANVSGGGENNTYSLMGSLYRNEGMVISNSFEKYSIRGNFDQTVTRNLNVGVNVVGTKSFQDGALTNDNTGTMINMLSQMPTKPLNFTSEWAEDVEDGESATVNNNPWYQAQNVIKDTYKTVMMGKAYINWRFAEDFRLNISGSYNLTANKLKQFIPSDVTSGRNANGRVILNNTDGNSWLNENLLYYTPKEFGKHKVDALAGLSFQEDATERVTSEGQNFEYQDQKEWGINNALTPILTENTYTRTRLLSTFLRANYTFDNRYLFTASIRADGSSRFGTNNKWAYFPSGAFSWRISEEKFIKKVNWITNLKLRMSAGMSGNTAIPAYRTLPMLGVVNIPMSSSSEAPDYGTQLERVQNPDLKWETSTQYDLGLDVGLFRDRLNVTVDLYYKRTRDLLLEESVPAFTGFTTRWNNVGKIDNKGLEITLDGRIIDGKNFKWSSSYNMSFNRSKVISLGERDEMILTASGPAASNFGLLRVGLPIGVWYGYETDDLFRSFGEIYALPDGYTSIGQRKDQIEPGRQRYVDQNNDGRVDEEDRVPLGSSQPKFFGGWQNNFSYKGFNLLVALEFSYGRKVFNATRMHLEKSVGSDNETLRYYQNSWQPDLYDMTTGELVWKGNETDSWLASLPSAGTREMYCKDIYVEDGSYLRISEVNLSYTFPEKWAAKLKMSNLKIYTSVNNLWIFTKYTGYDPEVNSIGGANRDLIPGVDSGSYPRSRVWNMGVNITF
jgi:TonB-linked SusC/RagA family outer membrane protein